MKSRFFALSLLAVFSLSLFGCGGGSSESEGFTIAVIPKGTTHEFWKSVHAGAIKAQRELAEEGIKVEIIWKGPIREDDREQQIQVVENFVGRRVDGIVLAPLDADALVAPVEAATNAGIPVVIIDSDLNTPNRVSYVATDNYRGGVLAAESLAKQIGGKGKVIMLRYHSGSASTEAREAGFLDTIQKNYPEIELLSTDQHAGATRETAYQAAQNLLNRFGREMDAIFAPNESSSVGVLLALRDIGRAGGDAVFVGFDAGSQLVEALHAGDIQGLVVQNPMQMGYDGVKTVVNHLMNRPVSDRIDTGVTLVTPENVQDSTIQQLLSPPLSEYID
jgi:ribose transport system substrate-binding protein